MKQKQLPVSDRHMRVIDEYMINGMNKYQAIKSQGYSDAMAVRNCDIFGRRDVQEEISRRQSKLADKAEVTAEWLIAKYKQIVEANLGDMLEKDEDGNYTGQVDLNRANADHLAALSDVAVDSYTEGRGAGAKEVKRVRVKLHDRLRAMEALGRHLGMFDDKLTVKGEVDLISKIQAGRMRAAAKKAEEDGEAS